MAQWLAYLPSKQGVASSSLAVSIPFLPNQTKNKCTDLFGMPSQKRRVLFLFPQDDKNEINVFDSLFFFAKQKYNTEIE